MQTVGLPSTCSNRGNSVPGWRARAASEATLRNSMAMCSAVMARILLASQGNVLAKANVLDFLGLRHQASAEMGRLAALELVEIVHKQLWHGVAASRRHVG